MLQKPNSMIVLLSIQKKTRLKFTFIDVKFISNSARLELFSYANIPQIADVALRVVFLLFLLCF